MKKIIYLLALIGFLAVTCHAQDTNAAANAVTDTNAAVATALTAADLAKLDAGINNLVPLIPARYTPLALKVIGWLGFIAMLGRTIVGWKNNGLLGVITGLFGGMNAPKDSAAPSQQNYGTPRNPVNRSFPLLLCLLLPSFMLVGCVNDGWHHQVVQNESGTGFKAKIPVGYNGNNIFELDLTVGTFKATSMIQPVTTNRIYSPTLVVAATTRGKFDGNAINAGANPNAAFSGGDAYIITTGHAAASETNATDITIQSWQDAPPSQSPRVVETNSTAQ